MGSRRHRAFPRLGTGLLAASGVIALLLVLGAVVIAQAVDRPADGPVYPVAALRAHLARDPGVWVDRPLRVRAIAIDLCAAWTGMAHIPSCLNRQPALIDPGAPMGMEALPLASGPVPPPVAFLRRLPLIGQVAPAPQRPRWDTIAVYRIELRAVPCGAAEQPLCYEALLLDAAP